MVRIIAGRWKGRRLATVPGSIVRPTADRTKEAWMSIVNAELAGARVLDLCAGNGALGIEALSRGAESCDFVDISYRALRVISENLAMLDASAYATLHRVDCIRFVTELPEHAYDVAFADPPYSDDLASGLAECWLKRPFAHILGIEHPAASVLPSGGHSRRYGSAALTIFR